MSEINTIKWQDLALENEPLRQQFMQYFREGYYFQAIDLIKDNINNIDSEAFLPDVFNILNSALTFLQNLYYNSVEVVLSEDEQEFQFMINSFINKKQFDATAIYIPYNFVVYNEQIYLCIKETTAGILPTNTAYWVLIGLKGEVGATAIDIQLRYDWDYQITYSPKDVVTYNNILYVAKLRNNNSQPDINPVDWEVLMKIPRAKIIVSPTEPNSNALEIGGQWWTINEIHDTIETIGEDLEITDSTTELVDYISAYGNTEQTVTTGAQLIVFPYYYSNNNVNNGITFVVNDIGIFTSITGTVTGNIPTFVLMNELELPAGIYSKSVFENIEFIVSRYIRATNTYDSIAVNGRTSVFDTTNWDYDTYYYRLLLQTTKRAVGDVINEYNLAPIINSGNTLKSFEPYTNELSSPSPEYPQPVKGFGYNSNLLDFDKWYETTILNGDKGIVRGTAIWNLNSKQIILTATENDSYTIFSAISFSPYKIPVLPNRSYTFKWNAIGAGGKIYLFHNGDDNKSVNALNNVNGKSLSFITNPDDTFITFGLGVQTAGEFCIYSNLRIYESGQDSEYYPYSGEEGIFKVSSTGLNLFDASKLPTMTQGNATVTNNGDGSFTISGSGTASFSSNYTYSRQDSLKIIEYMENNLGYFNMYLNPPLDKIRPYAYWKFSDNSYEINTVTSFRLLTQDIINKAKNDNSVKITMGFWMPANSNIVPGTLKPIGTKGSKPIPWVPFSGLPSNATVFIPSPLYKIGNFGTDYLTRISNQWVISRAIKRVVFDGSMEYRVYNELTKSKQIRPVGYFSKNIANDNQSLYADKFKWLGISSWNIDEIGIISLGGDFVNYKEIAFRIPIDANPNDYMDAYPTTVIYVPYDDNYPIIEPLTDNQSMVELSALQSYYPTTKMNINAQVECTKVGMGYKADIDTYMKNNYNI